MKLTFAIKNCVERKILLRGSSLLHPVEKLDRSVGSAQEMTPGQTACCRSGNCFDSRDGNFYLLQAPRVVPDERWTSCEFGLDVHRSCAVCDAPFVQPAVLVPFLGMVMASLDDSRNSIADTCLDTCLPTARMLVGPSPATWTNPC